MKNKKFKDKLIKFGKEYLICLKLTLIIAICLILGPLFVRILFSVISTIL